MSGALSKAVKEIESILKKTSRSGKKGKSYYDILSDQVNADGAWNEELLTEVKEKITEYLRKYNDKQLLKMWEESDIAVEYENGIDQPDAERVKEDVSEELLNRVLDSLDSNLDEENYFVGNKLNDEDDDEFEDFGRDDFESDDYFDDDDRY